VLILPLLLVELLLRRLILLGEEEEAILPLTGAVAVAPCKNGF